MASCVRTEQEGNFIDLSLTEDNSALSASLVAITNDVRARTRFIVAQPVTFSATDPERGEGQPAGACVCVHVWRYGWVVCCVKHMSPRVLRQRGVSREDEAAEKRVKWLRDTYTYLLYTHTQAKMSLPNILLKIFLYQYGAE